MVLNALSNVGILSVARIASTGANGSTGISVILSSLKTVNAPDNVRIFSTHGGQMMIGSALMGNGLNKRTK